MNHLLHMLSVQTTDWMNTGASFYVLVISYIWRNLGYDVVLWMAGLSAIPAALYEAAKVDGAGEWKCFTKITLAESAPVPFTIVVLSVLNAFKVFREAYLVASEIIRRKKCICFSICLTTGTGTCSWIRCRCGSGDRTGDFSADPGIVESLRKSEAGVEKLCRYSVSGR